jgi:nicotinamide-nucleotide amidase
LTNFVAVVTVGNEILDGVILDTNTKWIIERLKPLGFMVKEIITVRDEVSEIAKAIKRAVEDDCNLIVTSGGLGPTHDDMTLKGVAEAFHLPMVINVEALAIVTRQYAELHKLGIIKSGEITASRRKMAVFPEGAVPLDNRVGSAPGVLLNHGSVEVVCLPGVPHEMMWIFDNQFVSHLKSKISEDYYEEVLSLPLRDESTLSPLIDEAMKRVPGVWIKSLVRPYGEVGIRFWVSARGEDKIILNAKVKKAVEILMSLAKEQLL